MLITYTYSYVVTKRGLSVLLTSENIAVHKEGIYHHFVYTGYIRSRKCDHKAVVSHTSCDTIDAHYFQVHYYNHTVDINVRNLKIQ